MLWSLWIIYILFAENTIYTVHKKIFHFKTFVFLIF